MKSPTPRSDEDLVKHSPVIDYCEERELRKKDQVQEIYLLRKKQMNRWHAELFSFVLHLDLYTATARAPAVQRMRRTRILADFG